MTEPFTKEFFLNNRQRLQEATGASIIVIAANGLLQRSADTTFLFRQDSNFWYLTGINEPDFTLVITPDNTFLISPKRAEHRDLWDGKIDNNKLKQLSAIDKIIDYHEGWILLDKLLKKYKKVHTIAPAEAYIETFGFYANPSRGNLLNALKKHRNLDIVDIRKPLARLRQIKQTQEIEAIQKAIDITVQSLTVVKKRLSKYKNELEISADISKEFLLKGADGHAYQPIIASGINATTIHYIDNNSAINTGDLLLLDVGAEVSNYSADITRTFAIKEPTKRQILVYGAVCRVHAKALEMLKPGVKMREFESQLDKVMAKELKKLGLIDDIKDKKKLKKYYPHLTSHFLGLDTHDAADYDMPLSAGMVLTVEPGIYIPADSIGIRIEDDVLITENGNKVLSSSLPHSLT